MAKQPKAAGAKPAAPTALATLPEMIPTQQDGVSILDFFTGLAPFFSTASQLEARAKQTLLEARMLTAPTSAEEDEQIQLFIKRATADAKQVESHWEVTAIVSRFHKRLTGARARATSPIDDAKNIAQRLHNTYVAEARRKAAEEQERLRLAAEREAQAARQRELDALEARALEVEAGTADLSEREQVFVTRVAAGLDHINAARIAGYKNPENQTARLLATPKIRTAIEAAIDAAIIRDQAKAIEAAPTVVDVPEVKPEVGSMGSDRTTHSAEVLDLEALVSAVIAGSVPRDVLTVNGPKLNEYARSLRENINRWPGVRYTPKTRTV